jgi:hypothetical protein
MHYVYETCEIIFFAFLQHSIDEVEKLMRKHQAFENAAAAQEERFAALERLTTVIFSQIIFLQMQFVITQRLVKIYTHNFLIKQGLKFIHFSDNAF